MVSVSPQAWQLVGAAVREIVQQPTVVRLVAEGAARAESHPVAAAVAAQPEAFPRVAPLALDSQARAALLEQLAQPENAASTARLLASAEGRDLLARTFAASSTVRAGDPAETRALSAALRVLARSAMDGLASEVLTSEAARAALAQVLARVSAPLAPPGPSPTISQARTSASDRAVTANASVETPTVSTATPEDMGTILRILARPEMVDAARTLFSSPEARSALAGAFAALQATDPAAAPRLSLSDTAVLLNILSQPPMADIARQAFSTTEARAILARVLAAPLGPAAGGGAPSAEADAQAALRILAQPGMIDVARDVFSRPEVQARVPDLVVHPETRTATLDILMRPELRADTAQLFVRGEVANAMARMAVASSRVAMQTSALLQRPETAALFLAALARNGTPEALARWVSRPEAADALANLLSRGDAETQRLVLEVLAQGRPDAAAAAGGALAGGSGPAATVGSGVAFADLSFDLRTLLQALNTPGMSGLVSAESVATALEGLFGRAGTGFLGAAISTSAGPVSARAATSTPARPVVAGSVPTEATLSALANALARLANVSPERAQNLAGVLAIIAQLDAANTDSVLGQLAHRLEAQAGDLALKGGLPSHLQEPPLAESLILSLRFGQMDATQLADIVRALARQGGAILFIGRDGQGQVQIQFLAAELPAGRVERGAQTGALAGDLANAQAGAGFGLGDADDSHLGALGNPLVIANLRPADLAALGLPLAPHRAGQQPGDSRGSDGQGGERSGGDSHRHPFQELADLAGRIVREAALPAETLAMTRLTQLLAARPAGLLTAPQPAGATHFAFPYERVAAGVYVPAGSQPTAATARRDSGGRSGAEQQEAIPSLLDLIALDPPLLRYEPTELFIPGTWIPLILPPDKAVDVAWTALD